MSTIIPQIRSRLIAESDLKKVATLLSKGFERRSYEYWQQAFNRLSRHPTPEGFPKYGYLMEADTAPVGVILLIFSRYRRGDTCKIQCNLSSWYVEPAFRAFAPLLIALALKRKDITYTNISPAVHVRPIIEAQGFSCYSYGQFVSFPALSATSDSNCRVLGAETRPNVRFEAFEREILITHAEYGCISFWITTADRAYPFVFLPRIVKGFMPCAQLAYCRTIDDFVRFSNIIGWFLFKRGRPLVLIDTNGPISGLLGKYVEGASPKYYRGPEPPRLGDLAYTEAALFGL